MNDRIACSFYRVTRVIGDPITKGWSGNEIPTVWSVIRLPHADQPQASLVRVLELLRVPVASSAARGLLLKAGSSARHRGARALVGSLPTTDEAATRTCWRGQLRAGSSSRPEVLRGIEALALSSALCQRRTTARRVMSLNVVAKK
jgi:hypothetical protein